MANVLKMANINAILTLQQRGWSQRRIAAVVEVNRETVSRYVRRAEHLAKPATQAPSGSNTGFLASTAAAEASKPAIQAPPGLDDSPTVTPALFGIEASNTGAGPKPSAVDLETMAVDPALALQPAIAANALFGRPSDCEPLRELILFKLDQGLSAQRIYQDLRLEHGFVGSYYSVRRFVRRLGTQTPLPMRRLECAAGQEVQVDFGKGAPVMDANGKRRHPHVFRMVLSHSRKAYSEAVLQQTTENFIRCLENALWYFGGVPETVVLDNLKAAVTQADWFDPEVNPKVQSFCVHYGTVMLPTKPRTPRHKGKIERGIGYVQDNALKGRTFRSLEEQNRHLREWESSVADTRIHGTTRRQVGKVFVEVERPALKPLPSGRFPWFQEGQRSVNRDGHVEVDKAYYSAPPEYLGRRVWVRWDSRVVRIFNQRMEPIAMHVKHEPGRFSTHAGHIPSEKISGVERGTTWLMTKANQIGPHTAQWAEAMLKTRGVAGVRVLTGMLSLTRRHSAAELEEVCALANSHAAYRLRTLRQLLKRQAPRQRQEVFLEAHPLIRRLDEYGAIVRRALHGSSFSHQEPEPSLPSVPTGSSSLSLRPSQKEIDYRQLRSLVSMREILNLLGFQGAVTRGDQVRGACPLHGSAFEKSRVLSVNLSKNVFQCFQCKAAGNHLDLWAAATRQPLYQAALDLCNRLHRPVPWLHEEPTTRAVGS